VILCVASSPSVDKLFEVERVEVGAIHRPFAFTQVPGGKGLNVARAAHSLGAEVRATGILAGHAGRWLEEALAAEGVPGVFAWSDGETRASLSVADQTDRGLTEFYERGTDIGAGGWERLEAVVAELLPGVAWVTLSGNLPVGAPDDGYARLIEAARSAGARVALDARDEALAKGVAARPDVVKVNAEEAGGLLGRAVATMDDAGAAAREIRSCLDPEGGAIVTRGADGAMIATPEGPVLMGRMYARGPYPVGSGDAFLAGLVVGLERGADWAAASRLALGAAAANAARAGAGRFDADRAQELAARADVFEARVSELPS
jgi:1-phosphofructokinase family hexose kinase